jgi:DNA-binding FadR family transcriptional regulator
MVTIVHTRYLPVRSPTIQPGGARTGQGQIVRSMGESILRGDYPEGALLPGEDKLMAQFGISRTVLREALKTLAAKGLVVSKTRVGTKVRAQVDWNMFDSDLLGWQLEIGMDSRFIDSLYEIRLAVEPAASALAAQRRSDDSIARMRALIDEFRQPDHTRLTFAEIDLTLHLEIAAASGNPFMRSVGAIIEAALMASFVDTAPVDDLGRQQHSAEWHAAIVEAIARRDSNGAARAMTFVIEYGRQNRSALLPTPAADDTIN